MASHETEELEAPGQEVKVYREIAVQLFWEAAEDVDRLTPALKNISVKI